MALNWLSLIAEINLKFVDHYERVFNEVLVYVDYFLHAEKNNLQNLLVVLNHHYVALIIKNAIV